MTFKFHSSYGVHIVNHLAADAACLTGGEITVVALLNFGKYFDFFKTENKIGNNASKGSNEVNDNIKKLRDMFNNKK